MTDAIHTDVLVVGTGPAGATAALALATLGVEHIVVTKYRWTANTPRAHITNQRTVEVFRDLGIEDEIKANGTPQHLMGDTVFCTSLSGDEIGRVRTWGTHPARQADYTLASPCTHCDLPQTLLEPILVGHAAERGSRIRFDTEYLGLTQREDDVEVRVRDRVSGSEYTIVAKYVIGADGGRSQIARDVDLPFEGQMDVAGSMNIVFSADLSAKVAHRPSVLYWVLQPGSDIGGIGLGLVRMVRTWNEWLIVWGYDISEPPPELDDEAATAIAHNLIGDDTVPITIRSTSLWGNNKWYATRYRAGRVFCMGDAVHRHPPSNGLGSNTSAQDAYNLCWKLAFVLRGQAGPALLDSYDPERSPIGRQIVLRANKSIEEFGPIFEALGITDTSDPDVMNERMRARADDSAEGAARREKLKAALELKDYEFNAHGVEMGQRYRSGAVVSDGTAGARVHPGSRALLPPDHVAGGPAAPLLAGGRRPQGVHARPRRQGPLLPAHRGLRGTLGRRGAGGRRHSRGRDRRARDRSRTPVHRPLRRLGAPARGRRGRLRAGPPRRPRRLARRDDGRRPGRRARGRAPHDPGPPARRERRSGRVDELRRLLGEPGGHGRELIGRADQSELKLGLERQRPLRVAGP